MKDMPTEDRYLDKLYNSRFDKSKYQRKAKLWELLCRMFFQRYIHPTDSVLDIGAGYCEFINNIQCGRKIAIDLNADTANYAGPDVEVINTHSHDLSAIPTNSINIVFASNFFEHLPNKSVFLTTLEEINRVLVPGGKLLILQPNIRYLSKVYWDFLDHYIPLSDATLVEALNLVGLKPIEVRPRFLPYTTKSRLPQKLWLVRLYLCLPLMHRLLGKQAWIVASKPSQ